MTSTLGSSAPAATPEPSALTDTVAQLRRTVTSGTTRDLDWRRARLTSLLEMLGREEEPLLAAIEADLGRSRPESLGVDIRFVQGEAAHALEHLTEWAAPTPVPSGPIPGEAAVVAEPLGVVLIIGPWNYPVQLLLNPLVAALAAGNTAVLKPSEHTPATAAVLAEIVPRYLGADAVAVVEGDAEATQLLIDQGFDLVFFTGSTSVGRAVMQRAAATLTPVVLELGGKSPVIIAADADVETAAARVVGMKLGNAGQTCVTPDYVLVDRSVRDRFVTAARDVLAETLPPGFGQRIVDARQVERLRTLLADHGGEVVVGGGVDADALTVEPTVVVNPRDEAPLMQEEIFGPVLPVLDVDSFDDAVVRVNGRAKPLAAYVFTTSPETEQAAVEAIPAGGMVINNVGLHLAVPELPFGGVGPSGVGSYHGVWGFRAFSHQKAVLRTAASDPTASS